jgi:hypothetical protein
MTFCGFSLRSLRVHEEEAGADDEGHEDLARTDVLRQGEEVAGLRDRDHEHDPARDRSTGRLHTNTLSENLAHIQEKDRVDVIMANPPFGGKQRKEVQQNFPIRTGETAFLFLQHFIKMLKAGGRAGVVIKNTFLSNADNASVSLRGAIDEWLKRHGSKTVFCLVQFYGLRLDEMPRSYLARPVEIAQRLHDTARGRGDTILYEDYTWGPRAVGTGTVERTQTAGDSRLNV